MKTITKLALAVLLFMATAVSNHAQAQTKEETIQWLNDYGSKIYFYHNSLAFTFDSFDGNYLVFYQEVSKKSFDGYEKKVLPTDILMQDISSININGDDYFTIKTKPKSVLVKNTTPYQDDPGYGNSHSGSDISFYIRKEDVKNAQRLLKAVMHFAKLNGASELPKVNKNTF